MPVPYVRLLPSQDSLKALSDHDIRAEPPIVATRPDPKSKGITRLRKPRDRADQPWSLFKSRSNLRDDHRRDSGLAPSSSTARDSKTTLSTEAESNRSLQHSPSIPQLSTPADSATPAPAKLKIWARSNPDLPDLSTTPQSPFIGLVTEIPTGGLGDLGSPGKLEFSTRGSMLIGGKKATHNGSLRKSIIRSRNPSVHLTPPTSTTPKRLLSADEEILSSKVRSMYDNGNDEISDTLIGSEPDMKEKIHAAPLEATSGNPSRSNSSVAELGRLDSSPTDRSESSPSTNREILSQLKSDKELAGGIEDWENVHGGDVDRYGFIVPSEPLRDGITGSASPPEQAGKKPVVSEEPFSVTLRSGQTKLGSATKRLPRNRDRRFLHEAGDMLTLPPGLADITESQEDCKATEDLKRREREREEKWRKMARVVNHNDKRGGGMVFDFDTKSPKVVERTWKGIPDRWRATAWHAFLTTSARKRGGLPSDDELKTSFHSLLEQGSPDDMQIDLDVPRTISRHIMFRKRYRGGQRLLFRVLHCLSIYFPDTGYVQGMAALAATLLCYFDEEMAFVMLVRLWQLRGLERLYQTGFEGLMHALEEFETGWLAGGEVARKLKELEITPTAYGTRWYLTLFNYSIPFPAQLRVWDVFMLLGDPRHTESHLSSGKTTANGNGMMPNGDSKTSMHASYEGGLDVLHAVSAALIDGTREILLDSDFENAMKVLTSWIPIRDEELLMHVAKAEWKMHRRKR
ncbi:MAG: hypothetical protein LQ352_004550 [Teloschistes flavicans]|nr:MAG: hypothetical protein LQ352_004550 [Teloschistes flavicans]